MFCFLEFKKSMSFFKKTHILFLRKEFQEKETRRGILLLLLPEKKLCDYFTIRGGSLKKIEKKIIPKVPSNKNVYTNASIE
jgi:hypothetical protein